MRTASLANNLMLTAVVGSGLLATGCATKKYVRNTVDPVASRVGTVEKKTADNTSEIEQVGTSASRANERAASAERAANDANTAAGRANEAATQAGSRADQARGLAEQANSKVGEMGTKFDRTIENLDNYKMVNDQNVMFNFNKADLSKDSKAQLDTLLSQVKGMKHYVIEVEGFADRSGGANYNVSLSERRANAVIRYLTANQVPLRNIHVLGMGVDANQDRTRAGRAQARRVEVKIYTPDLTGTMADSAMPSTTTAPRTMAPGTTPATTTAPRTTPNNQ